MESSFPGQPEPVQPVPVEPTPIQPVEEKKPLIRFGSWIAVIYVIGIAGNFINRDENLLGTFMMISAFVGIIAAIWILMRSIDTGRGKSPMIRVFTVVVGLICGGFVFGLTMFVSLFGSMIGGSWGGGD